jgi:hypothetical protein
MMSDQQEATKQTSPAGATEGATAEEGHQNRMDQSQGKKSEREANGDRINSKKLLKMMFYQSEPASSSPKFRWSPPGRLFSS